MKISLGSWAFSFGPYADHPVSFDRIVKRLSEAGYKGIEISGFPPHVTLDQYPTRESRRELVRFLRAHDLGVSGYSADFTLVNPSAPANRRRYLDLFERQVEMCADIGSPLIRVDTGAAPGSIPDAEYDATLRYLAGLWQEAAGIAAKASVRVGWEFEPGFAFNKPSEVIALHDQVNHPNFTLIFDTSHAYMTGVVGARQRPPKEIVTGGVVELAKRLGSRIGHVHLIDSDGTLYGDETSTHRPFGQGFIDFEPLAARLLALPAIEWWCVDLCFCQNSWDLVEPSLAFVEELLANKAVA